MAVRRLWASSGVTLKAPLIASLKAPLRAGDKVVLTTLGTAGDVYPFVAIAQRLKARGMRPVVATSSFHRPLVESRGIEFCPLAPDETQLLHDLGEPFEVLMRRVMHPISGPRFGITRIVLPYLAQTHRQLEAACRDAALLVSHTYSFAAPLLAERTGIQWRSLCLQPLTFLSAHDPAVLSAQVPVHRLQPWLGPQHYARLLRMVRFATRGWMRPVRRLRRELGLPETRLHPLFDGQFAPQGVYAMFDPLLMRDTRDLPVAVRFAGFTHFDGTDALLPASLSDFLDRGDAPIVCTLGTSAVHNPGHFYQVASDCCRRLGRRAVFLGSPQTMTPDLPDDQWAVPWASHRALFARAALVVHQGGMGTCGQALRAGVPQLVVPFANDQPDNAARLTGLGVALSLRVSHLCDASMHGALHRLLHEPAFAAQARDVATRLLPQDGAETVAGWLSDDPADPVARSIPDDALAASAASASAVAGDRA